MYNGSNQTEKCVADGGGRRGRQRFGEVGEIDIGNNAGRNERWTKEGVLAAVRFLLSEQNTLFESLFNKLEDYPELEIMLRDFLLCGKDIPYVVGVRSVETALMFGFVKKVGHNVVIANRIFETLLYNFFLAAPAMQKERIVVDYRGEQFVIELKVWRGSAYHERGEGQLIEYLDYYHLNQGYMISFNFNKKKEIGVKELEIGEKVLIEAVV